MKKQYDKEARQLLREQIQRFGITQKQMAAILDSSNTCLNLWLNRKEPMFTLHHLRILSSLGFNPLYCVGYGKAYLPDFDFEQVYDNIHNRLKEIEQEKKGLVQE